MGIFTKKKVQRFVVIVLIVVILINVTTPRMIIPVAEARWRNITVAVGNSIRSNFVEFSANIKC